MDNNNNNNVLIIIITILIPIGQVPLSKVNFNAKHEYEYIKNWKVLQNVFDKQGIDKVSFKLTN